MCILFYNLIYRHPVNSYLYSVCRYNIRHSDIGHFFDILKTKLKTNIPSQMIRAMILRYQIDGQP